MRETCLILAAGKSERTGVPKGLISVDGKLWIFRQIEAVKNAGCDVLVVLGYHEEKYREVLGDKIGYVVNADPSRGQQSSIHAGLSAVADATSAFVLPVDVPSPAPEVWDALRRGLGERMAAMPTYEGHGGHPVLLSRAAFTFDGRLDEYFHHLPADMLARVPVNDPKICQNWNHLESYGTP